MVPRGLHTLMAGSLTGGSGDSSMLLIFQILQVTRLQLLYLYLARCTKAPRLSSTSMVSSPSLVKNIHHWLVIQWFISMFDFNKFIHIDRIVPSLGFGEDHLVCGSNNNLQCVNKMGIRCKVVGIQNCLKRRGLSIPLASLLLRDQILSSLQILRHESYSSHPSSFSSVLVAVISLLPHHQIHFLVVDMLGWKINHQHSFITSWFLVLSINIFTSK